MKKLLGRIIHLFIMPCSHVPILVEQENAGAKLSWSKRVRLRMHLSVCKACAAYTQKVEYLDRLMAKRYMEAKNNNKFEESEIENFKEDLKKKITP